MYDKDLIINSVDTEPEIPPLEHAELRYNDIATTEQFSHIFKVADDSPAEQSQRVYNWAKTADLKEALRAASYEDHESTEASNKLLKLAFMTPHAIYSQHRIEAGNNTLYEKSIEYHQILKEAIKANPDLNPYDFAHFLQGVAMETDLPVNKKATERIISEEINATRSELNFEMIMQSEAMKALGITYDIATPEENLLGADGFAGMSFKGKDYRVSVRVPIDVKSTDKQISEINRANNSNESTIYALDGDVAAVWSGVDLDKDMLIDSETAEAKADKVAQVLRPTGADYYRGVQRGKIRPNLGRAATRLAS